MRKQDKILCLFINGRICTVLDIIFVCFLDLEESKFALFPPDVTQQGKSNFI